MVSHDAFFIVLDDRDDVMHVRATSHAVGPWDPGSLHAGPPTALMANALARHHPHEGRMTSRLTMEILRPVPVGELRVRTSVRRPGRKVELLSAVLEDGDGTPLMTAAEWRIRTTDLDLGATRGAPLAGPEEGHPSAGFFRPVEHGGYMDAMEVRFLSGDWGTPGPATAWMRMRVPLLADEAPTGMDRLLVAADSGNGISASFDGLFVNVDLTIHLAHTPHGEWVALDARTDLTDHGVGLATSVLHDVAGPVGRAAQSLILDRTG